jgi:hypothetical protein
LKHKQNSVNVIYDLHGGSAKADEETTGLGGGAAVHTSSRLLATPSASICLRETVVCPRLIGNTFDLHNEAANYAWKPVSAFAIHRMKVTPQL